MKKRWKLCVIEGGGVFGILPSHFLSFLPQEEQNLNKVDIITGCSVGGLLVSAYSVGQSFSRIDDVFQKRASDCFTKRCNARVNPLANPVYRSDTIESVIRDMVGEEKIGDIKNHYPNLKYLVPALDVTNDKLISFENFSGEYEDVSLVDVSMYTSAAPSYFAGRNFKGNCIIDGGVIDVQGVITTVCELRDKLGIEFRDIDVFVLGTGEDVDPNPLTLKRYNSLNVLGVAKDFLVPYAVLSNKLWSKKICNSLGFNYYCYYNPIKTNGKLDDVSQIPALVKEADKHKEEFLKEWHYWLSL